MKRLFTTALTTVAVGAVQMLGSRYSPTSTHPATRDWYRGLAKPWYTPPAPVFAIVWSSLDATLIDAGVRLLTAPPSRQRSHAVRAWFATLGGMLLFPKVMFGWKRPDIAFGVTLGTLASATALVASADRTTSRRLTPLLLWLTFASVLQHEVWQRNR